MQGSPFVLMENEDGYHTDTRIILYYIVVTHGCNVSNKSAVEVVFNVSINTILTAGPV